MPFYESWIGLNLEALDSVVLFHDWRGRTDSKLPLLDQSERLSDDATLPGTDGEEDLDEVQYHGNKGEDLKKPNWFKQRKSWISSDDNVYIQLFDK